MSIKFDHTCAHMPLCGCFKLHCLIMVFGIVSKLFGNYRWEYIFMQV